MRIRTIKPDFWRNEEIASLDPWARLLAIGLLNYADDEGFFRVNLRLIKADVFPLDSFPDSYRSPTVVLPESSGNSLVGFHPDEIEADFDTKKPLFPVEKYFDDLIGIGYVRQLQGTDGKVYAEVVNFAKHQVVNKPTPSKIKDLIAGVYKPENSRNTPGILRESSGNHPGTLPAGREGKGREKEGKGKEGKEGCKGEREIAPEPEPNPPANAVGARKETPKRKPARNPARPIAADWQPSRSCLDLCNAAGIDDATALSLVPEFVLYWQETGEARPGFDATFLNHAKRNRDKPKRRDAKSLLERNLEAVREFAGLDFNPTHQPTTGGRVIDSTAELETE